MVQYVALLALTLPGGLVPGGLSRTLGVVALFYAVWLEWFVARTALQLPGGRAAMFVVVDLMLGLFLSGLTVRLSGG
ncbi:hypothetical protein M0638_23950 [Roseomonas sp. NAR14]|uniref:Uncharacterized protein n=1 Tax=Roseomonas acroporae TaxID=2937791 RepID=A0A9X1YC55_9PROT|nr:hypothetical protein [Roseomonas acroporae]MCK8787428.1 hypothetical protein [Roseomonas acroporae]